MHTRRHFLKKSLFAAGSVSLSPNLELFLNSEKNFDFNISLAQWSLHKSLFENKIRTLDFPIIAKQKYQISTVEYVNQFFLDKAKDQKFLSDLKKRCDDHGVKSNLIMIDQEGSLATSNEKERKKSVENHYKWVEAAQFLDCASIRVNLHGFVSERDWVDASVASLTTLTEFAQPFNIQIIVENHGYFSSNGKLLAAVIKKVNNKNCGTLPDFGNFCIKRKKPNDLWDSPCVETYDRYKGVEEMMPFAKGLSAKTFDFDKKGNETTIDYHRMLKIAKKAGFKGIIGIEYEGATLSEEDGIKKTKALLEKIRKELS